MVNYENVISGILLIPTCYLWIHLYFTYRKLEKKHEETKLFHKRHNCVVMYNRIDMSMRGWPPDDEIRLTKNNLNRFIEPYLYFLNTAKSNVSLAMMRVAIPPLFDALHEAAERGVKIRIIVNFQSIETLKGQFQKLLRVDGIKVAFYVDPTDQLNNIMHCKYMIKDYNDEQGYLCVGSMNMTSLSSIINNFEDVAFTSDMTATHQFYNNFEKSWNMINQDNLKEYNKFVLREAGFLQ